MEILKNHGDTEIFSIYQKFIRYCLPDKSNLIFSSIKYNQYEKEKCMIELSQNEKKIRYILNPKTRLFEEQIEKEIRNKSAPESPGEGER